MNYTKKFSLKDCSLGDLFEVCGENPFEKPTIYELVEKKQDNMGNWWVDLRIKGYEQEHVYLREDKFLFHYVKIV